ncbi:hypothetical protein AG1IA_08945 [Rhizoctonia solani AG-1 IA]|uniref:Uncharacterized protein n=1 Tax=Thanatephorus cucumeris (strain AG1-IA) TaxID=983506 RepID=L8WGC8_THACA|nr:hypothetical protein AG1IA_08945 [Rhizoctonia solani AG-1 IA]
MVLGVISGHMATFMFETNLNSTETQDRRWNRGLMSVLRARDGIAGLSNKLNAQFNQC